MIRVGGFFSGTGGIEYAFQQAGATIVYGCEIDRFARQTYERNLGHAPYGDITTLDPSSLPETDMIVAGFPCPAFSRAGQAVNRALGRGVGFDHPVSGQMFFHLLRMIQVQQPRAIFLENVANLLTHDHGRTFDVISDHLRLAGYHLHTRVMDASRFVPQHRERVYIAGFRNPDDYTLFYWPSVFSSQYMPHGERMPVLRDILDRQDDPAYTLPLGTWQALQRHRANHEARGNGFGYALASLDGRTHTLSARYCKDGAEILIPQTDNAIPRRLSPREAFRLQGFPESYLIDHLSRTQAWKQAGNAVVVPIVEQIARSILATLATSTHAEELVS